MKKIYAGNAEVKQEMRIKRFDIDFSYSGGNFRGVTNWLHFSAYIFGLLNADNL
jgi:hypothetical protein